MSMAEVQPSLRYEPCESQFQRLSGRTYFNVNANEIVGNFAQEIVKGMIITSTAQERTDLTYEEESAMMSELQEHLEN